MTDRAADLAAVASRVLPGGVTHAARTDHPTEYVVRAQGSRKWLVDGTELIDYTMGHGALLLGHAHPALVDAVRRQVADGTHFGAGHPLEIEWAERVCGLVDSVDEVRFTSSGTEAAMLALRVARAATGREIIVKLDDHFHGWSDAVSVNLSQGAPQPAFGVPTTQLRSTRVVADCDINALRAALAGGDVAAVILEASGAHFGRVPLPEGFVVEALQACELAGSVLIVDEVVTGFRVEPGGMQARLGVRPHLSIFGKIIAGGLPGGAVGGRRDLMDLLATRVVHPGTYNGNPLSAAAGVAMLGLCADGVPQDTAAEVAATLASGWSDAIAEHSNGGRVIRLASILHIALDDPVAHDALGRRMRAEGVDLLHNSALCSSVHTGADIERSVSALRRALAAAP